MIVLNAELKSMNSILTYESFLSRCVRAGWRAVAMASSVERLDLYANWKGSREGGRTDLIFGDFQRKTLEYFKQIHHLKKTKLHKLICSCLTVQPSLSLFLSIQVMLYHETGGETSQRKRESAKEVVCEVCAGSKR